MDTKARVNAIDGQKSGMLKKYGMKKNISPMTRGTLFAVRTPDLTRSLQLRFDRSVRDNSV